MVARPRVCNTAAMMELIEPFLTADALIALLTLTALEIVLGVDNVIFIAILSGKLPHEQQAKARTIGLLMAMVQRILLLLVIGWVIQLDTTKLLDWGSLLGLREAPEAMVEASSQGEHAGEGMHTGDMMLSVKELILVIGGLFLLAKATREIHEKLEGDPEERQRQKRGSTLRSVLMQILLLDLVFSVDSVLTAVGMTKHVPIMVVAVIISVGIMVAFAGPIARFVNKHPTIKMLALAILLMIGVLLVAEGLEFHFPRGYVYFAMAFSLVVELLNIGASRKRKARKAGPATA